MKTVIAGLLIFTSLLFFSCNRSVSEKNETTDSLPKAAVIQVTKMQFDASGMQLGRPEIKVFSSGIRTNGKIRCAPDGLIRISSLIAGRISGIKVNTGSLVEKGAVLCTLDSPDLIQLQQEYAESSGKLTSIKADYERQKDLLTDNISSRKTFLSAESDYHSLKARCEGLETKLKLIGLNPLHVLQGDFQSSIPLTSPLKGYINYIYEENGMYVDPQDAIFEIIDQNKLQLNLSVFEKDLDALSIGQAIDFYSPGKPTHFNGKVLSYRHSVDPETHAITVVGSISSSDRNFLINGMYIEAVIISRSRTAVALPDDAIFKSGEKQFVLVPKRTESQFYIFEQKEIKTGESADGYTEILYPENPGTVLLKGASTLSTE